MYKRQALTDGNVTEAGFEWLLWGNQKFSDKILYEGELRVHKFLYNSEPESLPDDRWKAPDVDFKNSISVSLSKFLQLTFHLELIYEKEESDRIQIKENTAFGIGYKFF